MVHGRPVAKRALFVFLFLAGSASVAALSAVRRGVATTPLTAASPTPASLPTLAAPVTVPLSNPSPGQPLDVTTVLGPGRAAILLGRNDRHARHADHREVGNRSGIGDHAIVGTACCASAAGVPNASGLNLGLYVQVLDGAINVSNGGGTQNFAAGQFGYTPSIQQPPIIVPQNPPAISDAAAKSFTTSGGLVVPIGSDGKAGKPYVTYADGSGSTIIPITLAPGGGITYVLNPPNAAVAVPFLPSSIGSVTAGPAASTLTLPEIMSALDATLAFGPTTGTSSVLNATFQTAVPAAATTAAARARLQQAIGGSFTVDDAVSLTPATTANFTQTPAFTFGLNEPNPPVAGVSYYVALFDANAPSAGLTTFAGPGTVAGTTIAFPSVAGAYTLQAGDTYTYALIHTTQTLPTPMLMFRSVPSTCGGTGRHRLRPPRHSLRRRHRHRRSRRSRPRLRPHITRCRSGPWPVSSMPTETSATTKRRAVRRRA